MEYKIGMPNGLAYIILKYNNFGGGWDNISEHVVIRYKLGKYKNR